MGRLADPGRVVDGEADHLAALLQQHGVAEGETVHDLDLLAHVEPTRDAVGDPMQLEDGRLLLRLLQRRVPPHRQPRLDRLHRLHDLAPVERLGGDGHEAAGPEAEALVEAQVLGAVRVGGEPLQRRLVLVKEGLARGHELLPDVLILVVGQHRHRPHEPERRPTSPPPPRPRSCRRPPRPRSSPTAP